MISPLTTAAAEGALRGAENHDADVWIRGIKNEEPNVLNNNILS